MLHSDALIRAGLDVAMSDWSTGDTHTELLYLEWHMYHMHPNLVLFPQIHWHANFLGFRISATCLHKLSAHF